MNGGNLIESFRTKVCREIDVEPIGVDRYVVYTPFMFDDGDHFVVVLRKEGDGWTLTDEGHTLMHLAYSDVDVFEGARAKIVEESLHAHGVENIDGVLRIVVPAEDYGDALYSFLQALSRVATVTQMTQERVASTFVHDCTMLLRAVIPSERAIYEWHHPEKDPDANYLVDCKINGAKKPCLVFAIQSSLKCSHATTTCLTLERWGMQFSSVALYQDQTQIGRRQVAQLSDVVGKQFSSLGEQDRIQAYFRQEVLAEK